MPTNEENMAVLIRELDASWFKASCVITLGLAVVGLIVIPWLYWLIVGSLNY